MEAITMLKERRSIRQFTNQKVDREVLKEIIDVTRFYPSWANFQIARFNFVDSEEVLKELAENAFGDTMGFKQNKMLVENSTGVLVLSYVKDQSGTLPKSGFVTKKEGEWGMFDAGIAAQTFSLAAHEKGLGTVILGLFDEDQAAKVIGLPENEIVAAVIPYGYPKTRGNAPKRLEVEEITRFK